MKPNHTDERGTITDLLVAPDYSITHITFTDGAVRGNHYHKETVQYDFILSGELVCKTDEGEIELARGDNMVHMPNTPHAYQSVGASEMISICFGKRKGEDYSKDTFKLDIPLL